ncbi:MAG: conjugal transfer protein TraF [Oscillospiraceae bacterium]|jgi:hypothetical protein|nr:conjugal transfer protein TraF [Oscillospiraceae bacterium]
MNGLEKLIRFLDELEAKKIYFKLGKIRGSILVEIAVPGERWEAEFFGDGHVEVERFYGRGEIGGESELEILFRDFSD